MLDNTHKFNCYELTPQSQEASDQRTWVEGHLFGSKRLVSNQLCGDILFCASAEFEVLESKCWIQLKKLFLKRMFAQFQVELAWTWLASLATWPYEWQQWLTLYNGLWMTKSCSYFIVSNPYNNSTWQKLICSPTFFLLPPIVYNL